MASDIVVVTDFLFGREAKLHGKIIGVSSTSHVEFLY
jgi:hypothetical protein